MSRRRTTLFHLLYEDVVHLRRLIIAEMVTTMRQLAAVLSHAVATLPLSHVTRYAVCLRERQHCRIVMLPAYVRHAVITRHCRYYEEDTLRWLRLRCWSYGRLFVVNELRYADVIVAHETLTTEMTVHYAEMRARCCATYYLLMTDIGEERRWRVESSLASEET